MVDPVTLGVVAAALVVKAAEKVGEKAVDGAANALEKMVVWLRKRFEGDKDAEAALKGVEEVPDSPSRAGALATVINQRADADEAFKSELAAWVKETKAAGVKTGDVSLIADHATGVVQNANVSDSTITVSYGNLPETGRRGSSDDRL
ncbi:MULTISPECIES: hypothetical protein [unclassified Cryobacterium]|uniref:hypothetical protein n=1 Tax=unclassified Cryobacterium TaxID=2649013 RepID=UPI00106CA75A|nr:MULTISPECIES: hypothetical protein [unclassified Cryobacterium]TFB94828.1 hypothetical protein E3O39_14255 [Cryobacterium sp. MDB2-A-1]TFC15718.1 hypothetical protein E3O35_00310 [Cryobacterium sp. MDB2-A-2]